MGREGLWRENCVKEGSSRRKGVRVSSGRSREKGRISIRERSKQNGGGEDLSNSTRGKKGARPSTRNSRTFSLAHQKKNRLFYFYPETLALDKKEISEKT